MQAPIRSAGGDVRKVLVVVEDSQVSQLSLLVHVESEALEHHSACKVSLLSVTEWPAIVTLQPWSPDKQDVRCLYYMLANNLLARSPTSILEELLCPM